MILRKKSKENHETHFSINPMLKDETKKIKLKKEEAKHYSSETMLYEKVNNEFTFSFSF